jgi:hypothetical protein
LYNYDPNDPSLIASRDYIAKEVIDAYVVDLRPVSVSVFTPLFHNKQGSPTGADLFTLHQLMQAYRKYMDEGIQKSVDKIDWYRDDKDFTYQTFIPDPRSPSRGHWSFITYTRPMFYINDLRVNGEWDSLKISK